MTALLAGIFTFFILEKLVLWRHCHDDESCAVHRTTVPLVIIGQAVHTFVDGIVIAATALLSLPLGLTAALAVAAHEVPQVAGDFAIVLAAGHSRRSALVLNLSAALGGVAGAGVMLLFGSQVSFENSDPAPRVAPSTPNFEVRSSKFAVRSSKFEVSKYLMPCPQLPGRRHKRTPSGHCEPAARYPACRAVVAVWHQLCSKTL